MKVLLSGVQPTGSLHLGNYEGALKNFVHLQNSGEYDCYYFIADWHALTVLNDNTEQLRNNIYELIADFLSAGLSPDKSVLFLQSSVKEHAELHLLFSMIIPKSWLERVPSYKEKASELGLDSYGFLGYPLLQSADILIYRADAVPVGKDQCPHIELTREVARRFNSLYGSVIPEPKELLTQFPLLPGTDGKKMSKSYDNIICMKDEPDVVQAKVRTMFTDPLKIHRDDPGHPETCPVYALHSIYNPDHKIFVEDCKSGSKEWGCVKCKKLLSEKLIEHFAEYREKRRIYLSDKAQLDNILKIGSEKARDRAGKTMRMIRKAMKLFEI